MWKYKQINYVFWHERQCCSVSLLGSWLLTVFTFVKDDDFQGPISYIEKMAPRGQKSERCLATMSGNNSKANWNGQTGGQTGGQNDGQDHVLSQADALTKNKIFLDPNIF